MKTFSKIFTLVASAALVMACSNTVKLDDASIEDRGAVIAAGNPNAGGMGTQGGAVSSGINNGGVSSGQIQGGQIDSRNVAPVQVGNGMNGANGADPLNDPQNILSRKSIYFDYDSFTVSDQFKAVVEAHARFLNANKNRRVIIQGNTDERGGREYNLALGQKRAEAVRRALALLNVSETQIEAVSLGKEKPKAMGADEAAYAENRRADLVYQ